MGEIMNKFKLGQTVKILDSGFLYSTYYTLATHLQLDKWVAKAEPKENSNYKVIGISIHPLKGDVIVYAIESNDGVFLVGEGGLEAVDLPCPFCGNVDIQFYDTEYVGDSYAPYCTIECGNCPCVMTGSSLIDVKSKWNTRNERI